MKKAQNIITKEFLEEKLLDLHKGIKNEMLDMREGIRDEMLDMREGIISQMDEKSKGYRDEVLTGLDKVMKELETMREEYTIGNHQIIEKLDDHEQRITKLESAAQ